MPPTEHRVRVARPVPHRPRRTGWRHSWPLAICCLLLVVAAAFAVSRSAVFAMRSLTVRGNVHLSARQVAGIAGLSGSTNVVWLSPAAVQGRLEADPWVRSANVSRSLPSSITVAISERSVAATVTDGRRAFLLSADGVLLAAASPSELSRFPVIQASAGQPLNVGARLASGSAALRVVAGFGTILRRDVAAVILGPGGVELRTRGGVRVRYGDASDPAAKARALEALLVWARSHGVRPEYVDVSVPAAPALRPAGESTMPVPSAAGP